MTAEPIRVGIVGLGRWGSRLLAAVSEHADFTIVGVCDKDETALSRARFSGPKLNSAEALFAIPSDAFVVACDPRSQADVALEAIRTSAAVFVEKPLAISHSDAETIRRAASPGQTILVDHLPRYMRVHRQAQQLLQSGAFGPLEGALGIRHGARPRPGVDPLWTLGPHDAALLRAFLGAPSSWAAWRNERGPVIASAALHGGTSVRLSIGGEGPALRLWLYFAERALIWVDEARSELRSSPRAPRDLGALLTASGELNLPAILASMAASQLLETFHDPHPLGEALSDFANGIQTGERVLCDLDEGVEVCRILASIERASRATR
jgi:predicted dehydrogenase